MFKDVFELKKTSWYMKLMKYIWGFNYNDFSHICPIFWLTLLNLIIFIPLAIIKSVIMFIFNIVSRLEEYSSKRMYEKAASKQEEQQQIVDRIKRDPIVMKDYIAKYHDWDNNDIKCLPKQYVGIYHLVAYDDYYKHIKNIKFQELENDWFEQRRQLKAAKALKEQQEAESMRLATIARKDKINKIMKFAKPVGQGLLILLTIVVAWLVFIFIDFLVHLGGKADPKFWKLLGKVILCIIASALIIIIGYNIIGGLVSLIGGISCQTKSKVAKFFGYFAYVLVIFIPIVYIGKGIAFIGNLIVSIIKNNCPAVKWED